MIRTLTRTGLGLGLLLIPAAVLADYGPINSVVNAVGGALPNLSNFGGGGLCDAVNGPCGVVAIVNVLIDRFRPLLTVIGVVGISISGIRMMIGQEDDAITKTRGIMSASIAGVVLAYLVEPFLAAFYGQSGSVIQGGMAGGASIFTREVQGVINWSLSLAAALAILMIVVSAVKALQYSAATSEEGITNMRKTVLSVVAGILLLVVRVALADALANDTRNPESLLAIVVVIVSYALGFFALAAVCVLVYAGIQLMLSFGNEEAYTRAKSILTRAFIGTVVFLVSLSLVKFVIEPGVS